MRYHVIREHDLHPLASLFWSNDLSKANLAQFLMDIRLVGLIDDIASVREYDTDSFSIDLVAGGTLLIYPFEMWER